MYGRILDSLKAASLDIKAIEIYRGGETVYHYDIGEGKRYPVYSVTKSITSAAFSLACADGLLTADMPLAELLPKRYISKTNDNFRILPIKRFLTMAAGEYPFRPYGGDWIETILSLDTNYSDTSFHYSNIPAYLVGAAVENAVGKPLIQYLDRRLFSPLGIPTPEFANSPEGYFYGATGMYLSVSELGRLGRLYLQNGRFDNKTIIPGELTAEAVAPHVRTGKGDSYGYYFRIADDHFSMVGKWGQRCIIYPEYELVIAYLSHQPERSEELYRTVNAFAHSLTAPNISR